MSKSSFYHFFANKTDLFQQILEQTLEPIQVLTREFDIDALTAENFWSSIIGSSKQASTMILEMPQFMAVGRMFHSNHRNAETACAELMNGSIEFVKRLLKRGQTLGAVRDDIPTDLLVSIVMSLGIEVDRYGVENMAEFNMEEANAFNEMALGLFMRLLLPEGM